MSVVDLQNRLTLNWNDFCNYLKSSDSYIYIDGNKILPSDGPASLDMSVGDRWFNCRDGIFYDIDEKDLHIEPHQSVIIETEQRIALPFNVFGLVTGKGKFIYKGMFTSTGKIDPGFNSKLLIGFYNGSMKPVALKKGDVFCSCCFFQMESSLDIPLRPHSDLFEGKILQPPILTRAKNWWSNNWKYMTPIIVSLLSAIVSITTLFIKTTGGK